MPSATFTTRTSELRRMSSWFRELAQAAAMPEQRALDFELCLNELMANVDNYGHDDGQPHLIRVELDTTPRSVRATLEDDGRPFDPSSAPVPDGTPGEQIGGWGIPIVRALADSVRYERRDGVNATTIEMRW